MAAMDVRLGFAYLPFGLVRNVARFLCSSATLRLRKKRLPLEVNAVDKSTSCLTLDIMFKNTSSESSAYAHALVWRSFLLCFLLYTSKFWSEELNYSRSPARFGLAIVSAAHCLPTGPLKQRFHRRWWAGGSRSFLLVLLESCFSFLLGRQRALGRGSTWHIPTPLSLLWLLFPLERARELAGWWVASSST